MDNTTRRRPSTPDEARGPLPRGQLVTALAALQPDDPRLDEPLIGRPTTAAPAASENGEN